MRTLLSVILLAAALPAAARNRGVIDTSASPHVKVRSFDLDAVRWTQGFWADRFRLVRDKSLPALWQVMQDSGNSANFMNLKIAAGLVEGKFRGNNWSDGDVYKTIETMAAVYAQTKDPKLARTMDEAIAVIAKAQTPEGYIDTHTQLTDKKRWGRVDYHELYNMGHLITAACIHHRATGKDNFLAVARKTADFLYGVFQPRPPELAHFDFNPAQVMGVVELYRVTRDPKYLELGYIFSVMRGSQPGGTDHIQTRIPLRKETEAVGHSVTGPYLWAGAADVYAETGEAELWNALARLWEDTSYRKMYITGGIAAINDGVSSRGDHVREAFGLSYQFPNAIAYNETCANIAHAMWSWRMLGISGDARYADIIEQVLYNSVLSGWGLDGVTYCYVNVLRRHGKEDRLLRNDSFSRWPSTTTPGAPNCYCCPPNLTRTIAELSGWAYGWSDRAVWVHLYGGNRLKAALPDGATVDLTQETDYPWQGLVKFTVKQAASKEFGLMLRIPGWSRNPSLKINGKPAGVALKPQSYAEVRRVWKTGDIVELELGMEPRLFEAHPKVEEDWNQVAVMRGPLVYCLELADLPPGVKPLDVALPVNARLSALRQPSLLGGVTAVETEGRLIRPGDWTGRLYREITPTKPETIKLRLIPYFAWNNRGGDPYMSVWLRAMH